MEKIISWMLGRFEPKVKWDERDFENAKLIEERMKMMLEHDRKSTIKPAYIGRTAYLKALGFTKVPK